MTQKELKVLFEITSMIHIEPVLKKMSRDEVQRWVAIQLAEALEIYTVPCGMSWAIPATKEQYEEYYFQ